MQKFLKAILHAIFLAFVFPSALLSAFGRIEPIYAFWAQSWALVPGLPGDYIRIAYYRMTLEECVLESRIQFGSFFSHPQVKLGRSVYIGSYCVLGRVSIREGTQIASGVQILSGRRQHERGEGGRMRHGEFQTVTIGAHCWIGAGAIVMADIGAGTTIGAGSVVTKPIPANTVAVGNPASVIKHQPPANNQDADEG